MLPINLFKTLIVTNDIFKYKLYNDNNVNLETRAIIESKN